MTTREGKVISIDEDKACPECGQPGATQGGKGLCLKCATKRLEYSMSVKLGEKTLTGIMVQIQDLLSVHQDPLNVAYVKHGPEKFAITFKAVVIPNGPTSNKAEVTIQYRPEPDMKDSTDGIYEEQQMDLFK